MIAGRGSHFTAVHPNPCDIGRRGASDQFFKDPWPVVELGPYPSGTVCADFHSDGIEHKTFGKGTILAVDGFADSAKLTIEFSENSSKMIISKYVKLVKK